MGIFSFGRKLEVGKGYSFQDISLFSTLSPAEIRLIEKKTRLMECKRGDLVYREGTAADAFYVIVSGRFRVFQKGRGEEKTLAYLYRGDYFGESSLLTDQVHSASVDARSDGLLLRLDKADFLKVLSEIPELSMHLSRTLGHRLTKAEGSGRKKQEVRVAALYGDILPAESFQFFADVATQLVLETKCRVIFIDFYPFEEAGIPADFHPKPHQRLQLSRIEPGRESDLKPALIECPAGYQFLSVQYDHEADEKKLSTLLTFLTYRYDFLLIRLHGQKGDPSFRALKQSDLIYLLLRPAAGVFQGAVPLVKELEHSFGFSKSEIKVIVTGEDSKAELSYEEKERILDLKLFQILPPRDRKPERYHAVIRFVTKELAGTLLGLVLGSGAAYGLAHIGVLKALEEENIPVDILAGSSMGALVAAFWGAGYRSEELRKMAVNLDRRSAFFNLIGFGDFSIAHRGFFHGRQVTRYFESFLGSRTFQDLHTPVKIVATSLTDSRAVIFDTGRVVDALRASVSIPGIFRPFHHGGEILIDGGILDPLPVDVLVNMGVKKIIAVNVLLGPEDRVQKSRFHAERRKKFIKEQMERSLWRRSFARMLGKVQHHFSDNIFNVIMNTIQFMEYEIAEVLSQEADVVIQPVVHEAHWAEFYDAEKFIKEGERKTLEQIDEIKRLLVE
jgi:NTE family protein